ncbi:MAG: tetratricopeptide repeat protein, partial [Planctomycetota bacterium]
MRSFLGLITVISLLAASCSQQITAQEYMAKGQQYVAAKDWKSAIIEFKNAVKQSPDNSQARALLGKTYVEIADSNAAIKELTKALELGASTNEILVPLAKAYGQGDRHQMIVDQIIPSNDQTKDVRAAIYSIRAIALLGLNNRAAAIDALEKARNLDENSTETRLAWARYEKSNGNVSAQLNWLKPLREKDGGVPDAWTLIGEMEHSANNLEAAEKAYSRSIELRPYTHYDSIRRAIVRAARGDFEGAGADIKVLNEAGANWPIIDHTEGLIAYQQDLLDEAQSHFSDALSRSPDFSPSQFMLGLVYFRNNNLRGALEHLEQYLATNPDEFRPNFVYASALLRHNNADKAIKILNKLLKMAPEDISVLSLLASAYVSEKSTEKAAELLKQAVKLQPDNARLRLQLGMALLSHASTVKS